MVTIASPAKRPDNPFGLHKQDQGLCGDELTAVLARWLSSNDILCGDRQEDAIRRCDEALNS